MYQGTLNDSNVCVKRIRVYTQEGPQEATKVRSAVSTFIAHHHHQSL